MMICLSHSPPPTHSLTPLPAPQPEFESEFNFNPFDYWNDEQKLARWRKAIDDIVEQILDVYTKGFNTATSSFSQILVRFTATQQKVKKLAANMKESQRILMTKPDSLKELHAKNLRLHKILDILSKVEYVVAVPRQIDGYTSRRQYVHAVELLLHTQNMLLARDLENFGALKEVRQDMLDRKNTIQEELISHLHSHIYLKNSSSGSDDPASPGGRGSSILRGTSFAKSAQGGSTGRTPGLDSKDVDRGGSIGRSTIGDKSLEPRGAALFSPFRSKKDPAQSSVDQDNDAVEAHKKHLLVEEKSDKYLGNPEGDSSLLMQIVIGAVSKLGRLASLEAALKNQVDQELRLIISRETEKIKARFSGDKPGRGASSERRRLDPWENVRAASIRESDKSLPASGKRLMRLLNALFSAFTRVLQSKIDVWDTIRAAHAAHARAAETARARAAGKTSPPSRTRSEDDFDDPSNFSSINTSDFALLSGKDPVATAPPAAKPESKKRSAWYVWKAMQKQLIVLLGKYWNATRSLDDPESAESKRQSSHASESQSTMKLAFSFELSDAPSVARMAAEKPDSKKSAKEKSRKVEGDGSTGDATDWLTSSPYHITLSYRRIVAFIDQCHAMLDGAQSTEVSSLRAFMNSFIRQEFIPRVQADTHRAVVAILADTLASQPCEAPAEARALRDPPAVVLRSSIRFAALVRTLISDMLSLPHSVGEYVRVVESACNRYIQNSEEKFSQLLSAKLYSAVVLSDPSFERILQSDARYQRLMGRGGRAAAKSLDAKRAFRMQSQHFYILYMQHMELTRDQLLWDNEDSLALMCETMTWLSGVVRRVASPEALGHSTRHSGATGISSVASDIRKPSNPRRSFVSRRHFRGVSSAGSAGKKQGGFRRRWRGGKAGGQDASSLGGRPGGVHSVLDSKISQIASRFEGLAEKCLFQIRVEVQMHCFFHLRAMAAAEYDLQSESSQPEQFVIDLNKDLTRIEEALSRYYDSAKIQYVFGNLDRLICSIMMRSLPLMAQRRVSKFGVLQITRNLYALQQNLTNIVTSQNGHFDRARKYFELINLSLEDLEQFRAENASLFSQEEFEVITAIYATNHNYNDAKQGHR